MPNRLANETSPYLLQHKDNPVEWYPWGPEALERAKAEDRPIFLSIGYSACHWCHVMEHESFENTDTAALMNELFISIKVDREERPDLDSIYMSAVQSMTGSGGWPMSVFLTPDGRPFYGGTYFPNEPRHGMPSFTQVLRSVADAYSTRRGEIEETSQQLASRLTGSLAPGDEMLTADILSTAVARLAANFDWNQGGFGSAPKFPQPMSLEFLLRVHYGQADQRVLNMVELSLRRMAHGGMYDQLGGGFHRYSVDERWLVPHFEKMLYDNALLSRLYLHAYQQTGDPLYRRVVEETLDYVLREMTDPSGGFYSTQDADSEGVEGKFFVWTPGEVAEVIGADDAKVVGRYWDVTERGNFEGKNILNVPNEPERVASELGMSIEALDEVIQRSRQRLYEAREQRVHPGRDEKVLAAWNGMMLRSFAEAGASLKREDYLAAAIANAEFLVTRMAPSGRLLRSWKHGEAKLLGYLEDYAMVIEGLVALYEATFQRRWLTEARTLADAMADLFWDESEGFFYDTGKDAEALIVRPRDFYDNAMPCGGSAASDGLLRLAILTGEAEYERKAIASLRSVSRMMGEHAGGLAHWLSALDFHLSRTYEVAIVGRRGDAATQAMLDIVHGAYLPNKVVAGYDPDTDDPTLAGIPLLEGRGLVDGASAAYVCEHYACQLPATDAPTLAKQLGLGM